MCDTISHSNKEGRWAINFMSVSKAAQRATEKYSKENYDRILVKFPKGTKERIQTTGETVNGFINRAIDESLKKRGI